MIENINWLSLILSTLTPMVIGFIYYQKWLFGKAWATSISMPKAQRIKMHPILGLGISFIVCFLLSYFLLNFCNGAGQEGEFDTFQHGATHGLVLSVFVIIPISITGALYNERSWSNVLINAGYWLISLPLMGGILDAMNHF